MDENRLKELNAYGIYFFNFPIGRGNRTTPFFGTHQSAIDLFCVNAKHKKCVYCQKQTFRIAGGPGRGGEYMCYDGCFSTTGYDSRTPDGWPMWIKRDGREVKQVVADGSCT